MLTRVQQIYYASRPIISGMWNISSTEIFFGFMLAASENENVLANPYIGTTAVLTVCAASTISFVGKYFNMLRNKPAQSPEEKVVSSGREKICCGLVSPAIYAGYPAYILFNGSCVLMAFWSLVTGDPVSKGSLTKQILLIGGGLFFTVPSVISYFKYNIQRIINHYIKNFFDIFTFENYSDVAATIVTLTGVSLGYSLSSASIENTAIVFFDEGAIATFIADLFSSAIAINNLMMTAPALKRLFNGRTVTDLGDYQEAAPCLSACGKPINICCVGDAAINGLATFAAVAQKIFKQVSYKDLTIGSIIVATMGAVSIFLSVLAVDRETIYVEIQTRKELYAKNQYSRFLDESKIVDTVIQIDSQNKANSVDAKDSARSTANSDALPILAAPPALIFSAAPTPNISQTSIPPAPTSSAIPIPAPNIPPVSASETSRKNYDPTLFAPLMPPATEPNAQNNKQDSAKKISSVL